LLYLFEQAGLSASGSANGLSLGRGYLLVQSMMDRDSPELYRGVRGTI